jgi:hypothetical protein
MRICQIKKKKTLCPPKKKHFARLCATRQVSQQVSVGPCSRLRERRVYRTGINFSQLCTRCGGSAPAGLYSGRGGAGPGPPVRLVWPPHARARILWPAGPVPWPGPGIPRHTDPVTRSGWWWFFGRRQLVLDSILLVLLNSVCQKLNSKCCVLVDEDDFGSDNLVPGYMRIILNYNYADYRCD